VAALIARALVSRTIQGLFMEKGWNATPVAGGWRLAYPAPAKGTIYAGLGDHWLCFYQHVDRPDSSDETRSAELYRELLLFNERRMFLAKFALDAGGDLILSAEVPLIGNYPRLVERTLDAFIEYGGLSADDRQEQGRVAAETVTGADKSFVIPADKFLEFVAKLELYNWGSLKKPVGQAWHLGYKGHLRLYDAYFGVSNSWAVFQVPVLLSKDSLKPPDARGQRLFLRYLLRLNDELYMVKFGIGENGQILLLLELPVQELDYELFLFAVRTISKYLEVYTQELEIMAAPERDEKILKLLLQAEATSNRSSHWN
jgi:hypothetical protein